MYFQINSAFYIKTIKKVIFSCTNFYIIILIGCCFIELDSPQEALYVLDTYNGFQLDGFTLKLNWVNTKQKENKIKADQSIPKKYSVTIKKIIPPKILYYSINRYMLVTWIRT